MKTAKAGIEKSVWALVLGLGLVPAAQAQPADSTGAGRVISSQGNISSSSGTTGTLTVEQMILALPPAPAPAPVPQSGTNIAWTMYFKNTSRCDWASCANIDGSGQISWASNYWWYRGIGSYGPKFPIGFNAVAIGEWLTCQWIAREPTSVDHPVTANPTINPSTGEYIDWVMEGSGASYGCTDGVGAAF
jgi:hypothetical protein